jgi:hypothetical protein
MGLLSMTGPRRDLVLTFSFPSRSFSPVEFFSRFKKFEFSSFSDCVSSFSAGAGRSAKNQNHPLSALIFFCCLWPTAGMAWLPRCLHPRPLTIPWFVLDLAVASASRAFLSLSVAFFERPRFQAYDKSLPAVSLYESAGILLLHTDALSLIISVQSGKK